MAAVDELFDLLDTWGLGSLAQWLIDQEIAGLTPEQIVTALRERPEYKARFPAMDELRRQARDLNMPIISEGQYLEMEQSYQQALANSGLPKGMYDDAGDFKRLLENRVAPQEVAERVAAAKVAVDQTDPYVRAQLRDMYGITSTDLMAYALDPGRGSEYIRKVATAATLAGLGQRQELMVSAASWERYAQDAINQELSQAQIVSAVGDAAALYANQARIAGVEGEGVPSEDVLDVVIRRDAGKTLKSAKRAARERARFAGTQGLGPSSLQGESL